MVYLALKVSVIRGVWSKEADALYMFPMRGKPQGHVQVAKGEANCRAPSVDVVTIWSLNFPTPKLQGKEQGTF